jgi:putative transposase
MTGCWMRCWSALDGELTAHLGYERRERAGHNSGNSRNGTIAKKVQTSIGPVGPGGAAG